MAQVFLVTGRSLRNYLENGHAITPELVRVICTICEEELAISRDAATKMEEHRAAGDTVGALCTRCTLQMPRVDVIETSAMGAKLIETRDEAKAILDVLMTKLP